MYMPEVNVSEECASACAVVDNGNNAAVVIAVRSSFFIFARLSRFEWQKPNMLNSDSGWVTLRMIPNVSAQKNQGCYSVKPLEGFGTGPNEQWYESLEQVR